MVVAAVCGAAGALGGSARAHGWVLIDSPLVLLVYLLLAIAAGFVIESRWAWIVGGVIVLMHVIVWVQLGPYPPLGRWTSTLPAGIGMSLVVAAFLAVISQASSWLHGWWRWTGTSKESSKADDSNEPGG